jgi:D-alanine-D-alanine ligase
LRKPDIFGSHGCEPVNIAVVFDTPYPSWEPADHWQQMEREVAAWKQDEPEMEYQIADALRIKKHDVTLCGVHDDVQPMIDRLEQLKPDLVFNSAETFHGNAQLDYLIPSLLEAEGHRFTGCSPLGLLLTRDKATSKKILAYSGVRVPGFIYYKLGELVGDTPGLTFPLIVKPMTTDASDGISQASVVYDGEALKERVAFIHEKFGQPAIAEEFVIGRELYVGMLGNGDGLTILPMTELVFDKSKLKPEERFATKSAKWDEGYRARKGIRNIFARPVSKVARQRIEEACQVAFRSLSLCDYARLDVRITDDDQVWVMEVNANPFISYGHDMANAAEKAGMDYYAFIQRIVDEAVARYERRP